MLRLYLLETSGINDKIVNHHPGLGINQSYFTQQTFIEQLYLVRRGQGNSAARCKHPDGLVAEKTLGLRSISGTGWS